MGFAKRISGWGIASLLLLLGGFAFGEYNLYLYDHGRKMLLSSWAALNQLCVVVNLAALVCGVVAMKRQSNWWLLTVVPAALWAVVCFFGDL